MTVLHAQVNRENISPTVLFKLQKAILTLGFTAEEIRYHYEFRMGMEQRMYRALPRTPRLAAWNIFIDETY